MTSPRDQPGEQAPLSRVTRRLRPPAGALLLLLAIEFLDELVFGAREAAWPLIRNELHLTYAQVGLLLSAPSVVSNLVEPLLAILSDVGVRRIVVLGGGVFFASALLLTAFSPGFGLLLASFILLYPASGAFVSVSQAALMDLDPKRREQNMARWTAAGSVGVVAGPLALAAAAGLAVGWRGLFAGFAGLTLLLLVLGWRQPWPGGRQPQAGRPGRAALCEGLAGAWAALRRREVLRWLALLECSDLMLDVLLGFLALYMTDVAGTTTGQAAAAVAVWTGMGLLGDLLLIPLLERVRGLSYLRVSIVLELMLYPAFLLSGPLWLRFVLLGLLGLFNSGWYALLQAGLYEALPGRSGTALAVKNVSGLAGGLIPLGLGLVAVHFGLPAALWLLLAGPIVLLAGLPRGKPPRPETPGSAESPA